VLEGAGHAIDFSGERADGLRDAPPRRPKQNMPFCIITAPKPRNSNQTAEAATATNNYAERIFAGRC